MPPPLSPPHIPGYLSRLHVRRNPPGSKVAAGLRANAREIGPWPPPARPRSAYEPSQRPFELAERLSGTGVTANALHPASLMDTKMVHETFGYTMSTVEEGAKVVVRLAVSPELEGVTGRYFDGTREARANRQAYDAGARRRLWA